MDEPNPQSHLPLLDYGEALRKAKTIRRCLPAAGIHWIEPGDEHCQCGKTATLRRPTNRQNK